MSERIDEQCESCLHCRVCGKTDKYKDTKSRVTEMLEDLEDPCKVEIKCRYYISDGRNELSNALRGVPCMKN